MLPGTTASPPNFFTPRRLDSESRPLRDEPPAFLCAISLLLCAAGAPENPYERVRVPFQVGPALLRQRFCLLLPILDLVGAERHVFVDLGDIRLRQPGKLGKC